MYDYVTIALLLLIGLLLERRLDITVGIEKGLIKLYRNWKKSKKEKKK